MDRTSFMKRRSLPALAALALVPALSACLDVNSVEGGFPITSNVVDWRDEIIYQLLVDRFGNGDFNNDDGVDPTGLARYQGGDWQGVIDHLDYLEALGVTALWISPVIRNVDTDANVDGYHGYWAQDFTLTNPHMGDLAKLRELVQVAHARGFKVILDIVANHVGQLFYYDINGNGFPDETLFGSGGSSSEVERVTEYDPDFDRDSRIQARTSLGFSGDARIRWLFLPEIHRMPPMPIEFQNPNWYYRRGRTVHFDPYVDPLDPRRNCDAQCALDQTLYGDFPGGLKDVNTDRPDVQRAFVDVYTRWIEKADFDAFRIDTLKHVDHPFWEYFAPQVRARAQALGKKNFFMFGEAFDGRDDLVGSFTTGRKQVDSAFFFPQKFAVIDRVIKFNQEGTSAIENQFRARLQFYGREPKDNGPVGADGTPLTTQQLMVNFLDNHDISRFLYEYSGPDAIPALHQALAFIFTEDGIPCVYYGTEQQFTGGNDPANRERLWDSGYATNGETFRWIRTLTDLRKNFRPLRRGNLDIRWSSPRIGNENDAGIFAFERTDGGKRVLVVMNVSRQHVSQTQAPDGSRMTVGFPPGTVLVNVLGETDIAQTGFDGSAVITVPPRTTRVYVSQEDRDGIP
jgi:alpha-amylase